MLRRDMLPILGLIVGGVCVSLTPGYDNDNSTRSSYRTPQNVKPGVSDEENESQRPREQSTGREELAYADELDEDIHHRANRKGDWDYRENWRYDRKAFYKGETQTEAYEIEHPEGSGGAGMDPDTEFLQMRKFYLEEKKHQNDVLQRNNAPRPYSNSQSYSSRINNSNNREANNQSRPYSQPAYRSGNRNDNQNCNPPNYTPNGYPTNRYDDQ